MGKKIDFGDKKFSFWGELFLFQKCSFQHLTLTSNRAITHSRGEFPSH